MNDDAAAIAQAEARQHERTTFLRHVAEALEQLRGDILQHWSPQPLTWWERLRGVSRAEPDPYAAAHRASHTLSHLATRLDIEIVRIDEALAAVEARLASLEAHLADALRQRPHRDHGETRARLIRWSTIPISMGHTQQTAIALRRSITALAPLVSSCLEDLRSHGPKDQAAHVSKWADKTRDNLVRVVRAETSRGVLIRQDIDLLRDTFDPFAPHCEITHRAERELVEHLRPKALHELLEEVRQRNTHGEEST